MKVFDCGRSDFASKPRLCVAIYEGTKSRILVAPVNKREASEIILDKNIGRSISKGHTKMIDRMMFMKVSIFTANIV